MFFKRSSRKAPPAPASTITIVPPEAAPEKPASAAAASPARTLRVAASTDLVDHVKGEAIAAGGGSGLALGDSKGGVSIGTASVAPGDKVSVSATVSMVSEGEALPLRLGPMFYGADGKIVQWWSAQPGPAAGQRKAMKVEAVAPEGATLVRLGVLGPCSQGKSTTAVYGFEDCVLEVRGS